jgi:16S rRNA (guanine527-N7)-methyltransferase
VSRFLSELLAFLPEELPNRSGVAEQSSRHLELIVEANRQFNLTRITGEREAAIKHVVDSLIPWQLFAGALRVVDAGSGAGFPGIPLAIVFPNVRFILAESVGKKARFIESAVQDLRLSNVHVVNRRAEEVLQTVRPDVLTARAVAPLTRAVPLFAAALKRGTSALLYKGPDAQGEIGEAQTELRKHKLHAQVVMTYDLPDALGSRTLVRVAATGSAPR